MEKWGEPHIIEIPNFRDSLGALGVIENDYPFPFPIKRIYFIFDVPTFAVRGGHAHTTLNQLIISLSGSFNIELEGPKGKYSFLMNTPTKGLAIPPGYWRNLSDFSNGCSALVIASEVYQPDEYIRDYQQFIQWKAEK